MAICYFSIRFWRYRGKRRIEGSALSRYIRNHRKVKLNKIDAVMVWKGGVVEVVYFFSGTQYWRYDEKNKRIAESKYYSYPKISRGTWRSIPFPVDGILTWRNDVTFFFQDGNVYKYKRNKRIKHTRHYNGVRQKKHFIKSCRG